MSDQQASTSPLMPDFNDPQYRQVLESVLAETENLHLLSLVDIHTGEINAPPATADMQQALLACSLFGGRAVQSSDLEALREAPLLASYRLGDYQIIPLSRLDIDGRPVLPVIVVPDHTQVSKLRQIRTQVSSALEGKSLDEAMAESRQVLRAWLFDLDDETVREVFIQAGTDGRLGLETLDELDPLKDILPLITALDAPVAGESRAWLDGVTVVFDGHVWRWTRIPYVADCVLFADSPTESDSSDIIRALLCAQNDILRLVIATLLGSGLQTHIEPFPETDVEFNQIIQTLRDLRPGDLTGRLIEGGFADHPLEINEVRMRCQECIYFLPNRRWCDLPELPVPVEPDWYCRLWKI